MRELQREEKLLVVKELRQIIVEKNVSPVDAQSIAELLVRDVENTIDMKKKDYERNGKFN